MGLGWSDHVEKAHVFFAQTQPIKPLPRNSYTRMVAQPVIVPNGPYAGLYMPLDGSIAYVKETRPYASPFINLIYDIKKDDVFYTTSPQKFVTNPAYTIAPQHLQDEYAYFYQGKMPYCNATVHAVKNKLTTNFIIITTADLKKVISWIYRQTDQAVKSSINSSFNPARTAMYPNQQKETLNNQQLDDAWLHRLNVNELLAGFSDLEVAQ